VSIDLYILLLALFQKGAVAMFLDPSVRSKEWMQCCTSLPPKGFAGGIKARLFKFYHSTLRRIPVTIPIPLKPSDGGQFTLIETGLVQPDDAALVTFTSGSTGIPKPVWRTHSFLLAQHQALRDTLDLQPGEVDFTTLPMFVLANLASGVTSMISDGDLTRMNRRKADRILRQMEKHKPVRTGGPPAFYEQLLKFPAAHSALRHFCKIYIGGGPVFPKVLKQLQNASDNADIVAVFGSTEAEPMAALAATDISPVDVEQMNQGKGLLAGRPVSSINLRIIKDQWGNALSPLSQAEFSSMECRVDEPGEVIVTGPHVMKSSSAGSGTGDKLHVDGECWHRTGDAGCIDAQGRLWLKGRCSARIQRGDLTIYPLMVETVAQSFEFVRRSALMQVSNINFVALELARQPSDQELTELRQRLEKFAVDRLLPVRRIPVDHRHRSKVAYPALMKLLQRHLRTGAAHW
jgi:olefin beta-lactone synthetase